MTEAGKKIEEAIAILGQLSVSGDAVDLMALAKMHLRIALELEKASEAEKKGEGADEAP